MDQESVIEKVRALWRLADHPNTGEHEKANAIAQAQKLMAKYQVDEIVLHEKTDNREAVIVVDVRIEEEGRPVKVKDQRIGLVNVLAMNNRCRGIIVTRHESVDPDTGKVIRGGTWFSCVGFKSDAEFVRSFYGSIVVDMMMALADEPSKNTNYQKEFCAGFVDRIDQRLRAIKKEVEETMQATTGMELVLVGKKEQVDKFVEDKYPSLQKYRTGRASNYDPNARARGSRAADKSDIGQTKMGSGSSGAVGAAKKELES